MSKIKILTIDDDPDILDVLNLTLADDYEVFQAPNGKEGLELAQKKDPNIIICDYMMPEMNGVEFCQAIKKDILLQHIPVIMLTGKGEVKDKVDGLESGADDYLVKPFEPDELLARIQMHLKRAVRSLDANPLTHLPGNAAIMTELQQKIDENQNFAVGYADVNKFKIFNDLYGFEKGDEIIRATARILIETSQEKGGPHTFVGHVGGDDFVFITDDPLIDVMCQSIIEKFDEIAPSFYNKEDREKGYVVGKDRQGHEIKAELLSLAIGIVSAKKQRITHVAQISEIEAELKKYAKSFKKSIYVRDKRET